MYITRKSILTGNTHTMNLDITNEQIETYANGALIQNAFPNLTAEEREFFKTGITPDEWHMIVSVMEDDDDDEEPDFIDNDYDDITDEE